MKNFKRILALVLAVMMVATSLVAVIGAADEDKVTYNETAIRRLYELQIIQGKQDGLEPDDNLTRAEAAQLVARLMTGKVGSYWENYRNDTNFKDLDAAAWAVGAISYAYEQGVVVGKSDVRFDPMGNVTYQDVLTMVVRSLGYTGLSYPYGFSNTAMRLGLTAGISGVDYKDAASRGVVATVIYNALYADDSAFAKNFNLTSGTYMLVATPTVVKNASCKIPGASIQGYLGKELNEGYVAFAEIGDDFRAINNNYVYAKTSDISDDIDGDFADKLGYAYELTFENDVLTWGDQCKADKFVNYGDDREIDVEFIDYDHRYNSTTGKIEADTDWFLSFGGQEYNLVDRYDADYTAPTGTHNIILYSDFGMPVAIDHYDYLFDVNGNIVDADDNVVLYYVDGAYYFVDSNGDIARKATSDEIKAAIAEIQATDSDIMRNYDSDYDMVEQGDVIGGSKYLGTDKDLIDEFYEKYYETTRDAVLSIARNYFCEITALDYNNDGVYDAAIYTPYYFGNTGAVGTTFTLTGVPTANGEGALLSGVKTANYTITGAAKKLGGYGMYLYTFNRHTNTIDIKEVAKQINSTSVGVEWAVKGKVGESGIYEDSQVCIGGTTYDIGGWAIDNLLGLYTIRDFDKSHWGKVPYVVSLLDTNGNNKVDDAEKPKYFDWNGNEKTGYNGWYYNGWNDVLEVGMTDACPGFKGVILAGHLIHGVPRPSAATTYSFVTFNPYQSKFAVENDQIVVDAYIDATGKTKTIKINSIEGEEFTDAEFAIFCEYIKTFYGDNASNIKYSYFFDAERKAAHQATALYKAVERDFIIDLLVATVDANGNWAADGDLTAKSNVYSVLGTNADGSYKLSILTPATLNTKAAVGTVKFTLGVSSAPIASGGKIISVNADTVWTFVAKDGIYTYTGVPTKDDSLVLTADARVYVANSNQIMIFDQEHDIDEICVGKVDWTEKRQNIELPCDYFMYDHEDTWALNEYIPYVNATFVADEVYMVTEKTANVKIYNDEGVMVYVYSNLYNLVDNKYEESVIFTGEEVKVFKNGKTDAVFYEDGTGEVTTNYGAIITRDSVDGIKTFLPEDVKTSGGNSELFNLANSDMIVGTYESQTKDSNGKLVHVKVSGETYTVTSVNFITVYGAGKNVAVGNFSKIAKNATVYFTYDKDTGVMTGYAFNA